MPGIWFGTDDTLGTATADEFASSYFRNKTTWQVGARLGRADGVFIADVRDGTTELRVTDELEWDNTYTENTNGACGDCFDDTWAVVTWAWYDEDYAAEGMWAGLVERDGVDLHLRYKLRLGATDLGGYGVYGDLRSDVLCLGSSVAVVAFCGPYLYGGVNHTPYLYALRRDGDTLVVTDGPVDFDETLIHPEWGGYGNVHGGGPSLSRVSGTKFVVAWQSGEGSNVYDLYGLSGVPLAKLGQVEPDGTITVGAATPIELTSAEAPPSVRAISSQFVAAAYYSAYPDLPPSLDLTGASGGWFPAVAAVDDGRALAVYAEGASTGTGYAAVLTVAADGSLTQGPRISVGHSGDAPATLAPLGDGSRFLLRYSDGSNHWLVVLTVSGTTVAAGTPVQIAGSDPTAGGLCVLDEGTAVVAYLGSPPTGGYPLYAVVVSVAGTSLSLGTPVLVQAGGTGVTNDAIVLSALDSSRALLTYGRTVPRAVTMSVAAGAVTPSAEYAVTYLGSVGYGHVLLDSGRAAVLFKNNADSLTWAQVVTVSGTAAPVRVGDAFLSAGLTLTASQYALAACQVGPGQYTQLQCGTSALSIHSQIPPATQSSGYSVELQTTSQAQVAWLPSGRVVAVYRVTGTSPFPARAITILDALGSDRIKIGEVDGLDLTFSVRSRCAQTQNFYRPTVPTKIAENKAVVTGLWWASTDANTVRYRISAGYAIERIDPPSTHDPAAAYVGGYYSVGLASRLLTVRSLEDWDLGSRHFVDPAFNTGLAIVNDFGTIAYQRQPLYPWGNQVADGRAMITWGRTEFRSNNFPGGWWPVTAYPEPWEVISGTWDDYYLGTVDTDDPSADVTARMAAVWPGSTPQTRGHFDDMIFVTVDLVLDPDSPSGLASVTSGLNDLWISDTNDAYFWRMRAQPFGSSGFFLWVGSQAGNAARLDKDLWTPYSYRDSYYRVAAPTDADRRWAMDYDNGVAAFVLTSSPPQAGSGWRIGEAGVSG